MFINGIESLVYGVEDVALCTRFFEDFGLSPLVTEHSYSCFQLPEGSKIEFRPLGAQELPKSQVTGPGVHEIIWGVPDVSTLEAFVRSLGVDRTILRDADGTAHFLTDFGQAMGLRVFQKKRVTSSPNYTNSLGYPQRVGQPRKWRKRARPQMVQHVVFSMPNAKGAMEFMQKRMNFRLSDIVEPVQKKDVSEITDSPHKKQTPGMSEATGIAIFMRANGTNDHHNYAMVDEKTQGGVGTIKFHHTNFSVDDIDEIMVGVNHMIRCGWEPSKVGLGRHRANSALFYYFPSPTGGEAEYGADYDVLDETWLPRLWREPMFIGFTFAHNLPNMLSNALAWEAAWKAPSFYTEEQDTVQK